jgi:hypothetical protein
VTPPLKFTNFTANWTTISAGQSVKFTNTTAGGTGTNVYSYTVSSCTSGDSQNGNKFTFPNAGNCTVTEHVNDTTHEVNMTSGITIKMTYSSH